MKAILKLEELAMFLLGIFLFSQLSFSWWWFLVFIMAPDIGMLGYLKNEKIGAWFYNLFHHKGLALLLYLVGVYSSNETIQFVGIILFAHASFDRLLGYGLKYEQGFKFTHLGEI
ncbi:DUF4260 domain-containing protein [Mangrovimonas sp. AS39]|uniref:DUF4260 domain-containing protein n=1 Tax=Mangrovimonas futianensis TaxID=2895523 RepID=UPI001E2A2391|nr:DUF4260 domain-containing protein [Mangrovimonas futianensis]MCF1190959.1 DUF4260 domain-containing protein [Mangrovimonas futianensis]MCF1194655.1 DUF4260 domain-containing protein [Mangrovimonas futianensis]